MKTLDVDATGGLAVAKAVAGTGVASRGGGSTLVAGYAVTGAAGISRRSATVPRPGLTPVRSWQMTDATGLFRPEPRHRPTPRVSVPGTAASPSPGGAR